MNIVLFTHPAFLASQSMPRYARWIETGMKERGHHVTVWTPKPFFYNIPAPSMLKKWLGYIDQYLVFPRFVRREKRRLEKDTLFVFADHALGPWVPLVADSPHVIHCHDFLAQRSALGEIPENNTGSSGKIYQRYIRSGFQKGSYFVSISEKTREDLHRLLKAKPKVSEVVYNGLTQEFTVLQESKSVRLKLSGDVGYDLTEGYILHVGGNQWYKNRRGVIEIYEEWRTLSSSNRLPLLMIGSAPTTELRQLYEKSRFKSDIHFLSGKSDEFVKQAYGAASLFLFPSLDEGFGWPLIEAMASGSPVVTTNNRPMTEVAAEAAVYVERRPFQEAEVKQWAHRSALVVSGFFEGGDDKRATAVDTGLRNVKRFSAGNALDRIENIYKTILGPQTK